MRRLDAPDGKGLLAVGLIALAASANTLLNGFVYDDSANILVNPWIRDVGLLPAAFKLHVAAFDPGSNTSFYRPLMHVIYAACYALFGLRAWGYHLVNLLFHATISAGVYLLAARSCAQASAPPAEGWDGSWRGLLGSGPFLAALLFAVHPIHSEAVAWNAGITDLSYTLFLLLALLLVTEERSSEPTRLLVAPALFLVAMLCKEPGVILLPVLAVVIMASGELGDPSRRRRALATLGAFAAAAAVYLALRLQALGGLAGTDRRVRVGPWEALATGVALLGEYVKKLVLPFGLSPLHDFPVVTGALDSRLWLGGVAVALVVVASWRLWRSRGAALGLALLVLPLLPALYLPALGEGLFAERYLYLPTVGAAILIALALEARAWTGAGRTRLAAAVAVVALVLAGATIERNQVWRSDLSLWSDTAPKVPGSAAAQANLGFALYTSGRPGEAVARLEKALRLEPGRTEARVNLAGALVVLGRDDEAVAQVRQALQERPDHAMANGILGLALAAEGRADEAIAAYERALAINPALPTVHNALGIACAQQGDAGRAAWHFQEAARLDPANPAYARNLGLLGR